MPIDHSLHATPDRPPLHQGTHGQTRVLTWPGVASDFVELFTVNGDAPQAQALSLLFGEPTNPDGTRLAGAGQDIDVEARVTFGVQGVSAEARLDFLAGTRLTIAATYLRLEARLAAAGGGVAVGTQFRVGAAASYGPSGSSQGQRTLRATGVIGGGTADFTVPPFAKGATVFVSNITAAGGYSLTWLDSNAVAIGTRDFPVGAAAFGAGPGPESPNDPVQIGARAGLPMPQRARTLRFTNGAGAAVRAIVSAIFEIQL